MDRGGKRGEEIGRLLQEYLKGVVGKGGEGEGEGEGEREGERGMFCWELVVEAYVAMGLFLFYYYYYYWYFYY